MEKDLQNYMQNCPIIVVYSIKITNTSEMFQKVSILQSNTIKVWSDNGVVDMLTLIIYFATYEVFFYITFWIEFEKV